MLRSTCPNHLILLVRSTTSNSWMPSFVRRESELLSSFALTLQIQRIMARSLPRRDSVYQPSWPKSLLHVASHSSHMMSTPYLCTLLFLCGIFLFCPTKIFRLSDSCPATTQKISQRLIMVNVQLISTFVFATYIVQSLCFLNPIFQASSHLLRL